MESTCLICVNTVAFPHNDIRRTTQYSTLSQASSGAGLEEPAAKKARRDAGDHDLRAGKFSESPWRKLRLEQKTQEQGRDRPKLPQPPAPFQLVAK